MTSSIFPLMKLPKKCKFWTIRNSLNKTHSISVIFMIIWNKKKGNRDIGFHTGLWEGQEIDRGSNS